jgi:SAM-dependent methyltransferase
MNTQKNTSWQPVSKWYDNLVGEKGQYYHQSLIIPGVLKLLNIRSNSKVLDLACGQGILERHIPKDTYYQGIDISRSLIESANSQKRSDNHFFTIGNIVKKLPINKHDFNRIAIILALQNIKEIDNLFTNLEGYIAPNSIMVIVLNHPCFRIPRQSSWEIEEKNKMQFRRINRYMTPLDIPINTHPGDPNSSVTWSFHQPLSFYSKMLQNHGFVIDLIDEWTSEKESEGKFRKMENRSRNEIPLFMAIKALKIK